MVEAAVVAVLEVVVETGTVTLEEEVVVVLVGEIDALVVAVVDIADLMRIEAILGVDGIK
jgi:hypothetical protein